jgi:hypothetical protein
MGFLSPDANEQKSAFTTASMVEQNPRIQVIFVNLVEEWQPGSTPNKKLGLPQLQLGLPQLQLGLPQLQLGFPQGGFIQFLCKHPLLVIAGLMLILFTHPFQENKPNEIRRINADKQSHF